MRNSRLEGVRVRPLCGPSCAPDISCRHTAQRARFADKPNLCRGDADYAVWRKNNNNPDLLAVCMHVCQPSRIVRVAIIQESGYHDTFLHSSQSLHPFHRGCVFVLREQSRRAVTTSWNTNASGDFTTAANWDNGVPDSDDTAVFNRGFVAYEVNFPGGLIFDPPMNYPIQYLRVRTNEVSFVHNPSPSNRTPASRSSIPAFRSSSAKTPATWRF